MATPDEHTSLGQTAERYWVESQRPLAALAFLTPLLAVYEVGILLLGAHQNGADAFLRRLLELLGFGQHFLLPMLLVCLLLGWQYVSRQPWRLSGGVLSAMAVESVLFGLLLRVLLCLQLKLVALSIGQKCQDAIGFLGAGIYEELLFRLILLTVLLWVLRRAGLMPRAAMVAAVVIGSLLFAAAHNVGPYGEPYEFSRFAFRFMAGVLFSLVFVYRGFGIAAGSHAAYDILVGVFG